MMLGQIVAKKDWLGWAYGLRLNNGARAYHLRKILDAMSKEIKKFDELRDGYIKATGRDTVREADPEFPEILERLNEALSTDVSITVTAVVELGDLANTKASPNDLANLEELGLLVDPEPAAPVEAPKKPRGRKPLKA